MAHLTASYFTFRFLHITVLNHACVMHSDKLDSEAIVEFVKALCAIAQEELDPAHAPRVYGLTKIVEIAHFNMSRIRQGLCC